MGHFHRMLVKSSMYVLGHDVVGVSARGSAADWSLDDVDANSKVCADRF
jgi:hypothetical protein